MAKAAKPAKPPKVPKAPKEPKPRKAKADAAPVSTTAGSNTLDPDKRALFLSDKDAYAKAKERLNKAQQAVRALGKVIKADGFSMRQIKLAIQLETPEGEADFKALVANDLLAAQYQGAAIGSQLQLFLEPDRTPAVDMAFDEGTKDCLEGKAAKPGYAPETEQYRRYMEGYHGETARRVAAGIGSDVKPNPTRAEILQTARDKQASEADKFH
jgi:hypothetical protein